MDYNGPLLTIWKHIMSDSRSTGEKLFGAICYPFLDDKPHPGFFSKYQSASDFGFRAASVVTAAPILAAGACSIALEAVSKLIKVLAHLVILDFSSAKNAFLKSAGYAGVSAGFLVAAVLSPIVNLIDLIGGAINSLFSGSEQQANQQANNEEVIGNNQPAY